MKTRKRVLAAGAAALTLGIVFLTNGLAADEKDERAKQVRAVLDKMAAAAATKPDDLPKEAAKLVSDKKIAGEDEDSFKAVMEPLGKRDPDDPIKFNGWGVGDKPGEIKPDGIELKLRDLVKDLAKTKPEMTQAKLEKQAKALVQLANRTAAVGSVALAAAPKKKEGDKDPKDWKEYADDMVKASHELAKAAGSDKPDLMTVKKAINNLQASCTNCHGKFRVD